VVAPGSLDARYERLAGDDNRRKELYYVRVRLGYSIPEWLALPWWQRRLYLEQMAEEAEERAGAAGGAPAGAGGMSDALSAIYDGTIEDVAAAGGFSTD
jgi:hypothetical protein